MVKKVLILGSGFVAKPTVDILSKTEGVKVTVACRTIESAKALAGENAAAISLDASEQGQLDDAVSHHDLVISLIPYTLHVAVIKSAIKFKKDVVTTSYISPAIRALEEQVNDAGITVFNEIGMDPGIDHLYAVKTIDEVHRSGGKIKSFTSYCGGLVAPENSNNPLKFKFSWSARGALLGLRNSASFYKNGMKVDVYGRDLMAYTAPYKMDEFTERELTSFPNRDSTVFKELYQIPEAETVVRGSLRFEGFTEFIKVLVDLGLMKDEHADAFTRPVSWNKALAQYLGAKSSGFDDLVAAIESKASFPDEEAKAKIIDGFEWFGILSEKNIIPKGNPLDTLCALFEDMLKLEEGDRDLVLLQHKFGVVKADGAEETRTSTLVAYGAPTGSGYSAMAKLVGTPCAIAARLLLTGKVPKKGLIAPYSPEINDPIRKILKEEYGIELIEKTV